MCCSSPIGIILLAACAITFHILFFMMVVIEFVYSVFMNILSFLLIIVNILQEIIIIMIIQTYKKISKILFCLISCFAYTLLFSTMIFYLNLFPNVEKEMIYLIAFIFSAYTMCAIY